MWNVLEKESVGRHAIQLDASRRRSTPKQSRYSYACNAMRNRSDHVVKSLPYLLSQDHNTVHYAGHLPADKAGDRQLFYWLISPSLVNATNDAPLVIWLNGGPGYSSLVGLFLENGPIRLVNRTALKTNPHSWHTAPAWVLYVDQPVGTGLSFDAKQQFCTNDDCICDNFHHFLQQFLWLHRDDMLVQNNRGNDVYTLSRPLYFAGESYAGHYIPTIIDYIVQLNKNPNDTKENELFPTIDIDIAGAAIGNGYMDPLTGWNNAQVEYGFGLVDLSQKAFLDTKEMECNQLVNDEADEEAIDCLESNFCEYAVKDAKAEICDYDARLWFPAGQQSKLYPPGRVELEAYLNDQSVLEAIHAIAFAEHSRKFRVSSGAVGSALGDYYELQSVSQAAVRILHENIRLLFYNGIMDLMCDHFTNEKFLSQLSWKGRSEWVMAKRYAWNPFWQYNHEKGNIGILIQRPSGFAKQHDGLYFLKILDAGHLVPMDQPEVSLEMMKTFLRGDPFMGIEQRLQQLDPLEQVLLAGTFGDAVSDESIPWLILGCIVVASCSVGFFFGRWSNSCSAKYANHDSVPGSKTDEECVELVEVT
jgi:carboxypeptidase C (cathepsin A)